MPIKVIFSSQKDVYGLTEEQTTKIKEDLTIDNPAYLNAMKYSKYAVKRIPKYLFYYSQHSGYLTVPSGYTLPFDNFILEDKRSENTVSYPPFKLELRETQKEALTHYLVDTDKGIIVLPTGKGKASPLYTNILTPKGFIQMKDIELNQKVIGEDGKPHNVIGIYPQGKKPIYEITFKDGTATRCSDEHLWKVRTKNMKKLNTKYEVMTLNDMLKLPLREGRSFNLRIPLTKPIEFESTSLPLHPYALGVLLGDGCFSLINSIKQSACYFTNPEEDIVNKLNNLIKEFGYFYKNESTQCQYNFTSHSNKRGEVKNSKLFNIIRNLNLVVKGEYKFIPDIYKYASIQDRFQLLQGLFDTDGCVCPNGSYVFDSANKTLTEDVLWLCRSLGYRPTLSVHDRRGRINKVNGKNYTTKSKEYIIRIPTHDLIFTSKKHLEKNVQAVNKHTRNNINKYDDLPITKIEYIGEEECQCIMVDSKDHTYICDDFIVTHNTILALNIAYRLRQKTLVIVHKDDLASGWKEDAELCFGKKLKTGLLKAKKKVVGEQITIAMIQTLNRMSKKELSNLYNEFGCIIVDECLVADTLIALEDGGFKFIKDITNSDKLIGGKVSNAFNRSSQIYRVKTAYNILEGSPTHPTFVYRNGQLKQIPLESITKHDYIPIITKIPHTQKHMWTPKQLSLVALIQADGHLDLRCNRVKVNVSNDQSWYKDLFETGVSSFRFNSDVHSSYDTRGNLTVWSNNPTLKHHLENTFDVPRGKKSDIITLNEQIQYSPLESIRHYLGVIFSCEGDLNLNDYKSCRINLNMTSKEFVLGIQHLLKKFNIVAKYLELSPNKQGHSTRYRLSICGDYFNKFMDTFSDVLLPRKYTPFRNKPSNKIKIIDEYLLAKVSDYGLTKRIEKVYDYTTTSHTFIANGALTHNCHHISSSSFDLLNDFNCPYKIGLSATPERSDGLSKAMNFHLGEICYQYEATRGDIDILDVKVLIKKSTVKYIPMIEIQKGVKIPITDIPYKERPRIDYHEIDNTVVLNEDYMLQVCSDVSKEYIKGRSCVVFFSQKEHVRIYKDYMIENGLEESHIQMYYGDATESKEEMKRKAESKEVYITLATYSIATEGTNVKAWEVCFLVSSINNEKNTEQATGRIRRSKEGKINPCLVYDYIHPEVYTVNNHIFTRKKRYKKLHFEIVEDKPKGLFFSKGQRK